MSRTLTAIDDTLTRLRQTQAELDATVGALQAERDVLAAEETPPDPPPPVRLPIYVGAGANLQAVLDAATPGDEIRIASGATFTGNFVIRASGTPEQPILIRADVGLPDRRIGLADAPALFTLAPVDATQPVVRYADGVHDTRIVGMAARLQDASRTLIEIGRADVTSLDTMPTRHVLEQCVLRGTIADRGHRGVQIAAQEVTLRRNWIGGFVEPGRDSQGVWIYAGRQITVEDNQIEASGENILVGGADVKAEALMPQDLVFRDNTVYKPQAWRTITGSVKNLFELKVGLRVLIEHNIFDGCWKDAQPGSGIVMTTRNQDGTAPWSQIGDVIFSRNRVRNITDAAWLNILSIDDTVVNGTLRPSRPFAGLLVELNLITGVRNGIKIGYGGSGFWFRYNTTLGPQNWAFQFHGVKDATGAWVPISGLVVDSNITPGGDYGIAGDYGAGVGAPTLAVAAPGYVWTSNAVEQTVARYINWPAGTIKVPAGTLAGQIDAATGVVLAGSGLGAYGCDPTLLP